MEDLQKVIFQFEADSTNLDSKLTKITKDAVTAQGAERDAYIAQLGVLQKLKVEAELLRKAREKANDPKQIKDYSDRLKELTTQARNLTGAMQPKSTILDSIKNGFGFGAGFSIVQGLQRAAMFTLEMGKNMLFAADAARNNRIAIEGIFNSREKAFELDKQAKDLDAKSPLNLAKIKEYSLGLAGVDIAFNDIIKDIKALGDVAAGGGNIAKLDQLQYAYKQVAAAGKLMGTEVRQFTEAGVPLVKYLAEQNGKSMMQIRKDIEDGKVSFEQVRSVFRNLSGEGGKFYNAMEKQSKSLTGQLSMLESSFNQISVSIGERSMPMAMGLVSVFNDLAETTKKLVAIPMSEKLEEEQTQLTALVLQATSMNENYESRAELIREIKSEYPEFLAGLDAETVANDALLIRLEKVNALYRKRIELEQIKEDLAPLQDANKKGIESESRQQREVLSEISDKLKGQRPFDYAQYTKLINEDRAAADKFVKSELSRAGIKSGQQAYINKLNFGTILSGASTLNDSRISKLTKELNAKESEVQASTIQQKQEALNGTNARLEMLKKDKAGFAKDSELFIQADAEESRLLKEKQKVTIDLAKLQIDRIDGQLQKAEAEYRGLSEIFNQAKTGETASALTAKRKEIQALRAELAKYNALLPKENNAEPISKGAKSKEESLAEKRIKAKQDLQKEIDKLNFEIEKAEEKDGFRSIERIKKRIALDIEVERQGLENKMKTLVRTKVFSQAEADAEFKPVFDLLKKKANLLEINEIKKFNEDVEKLKKEHAEKLQSLTIDIETERLGLLRDDLAKEQALIEIGYDKQLIEVNKKYDNILEALKKDLDSGLILQDEYAILEQEIIELNTKAVQNLIRAKNNAILVLNQKALEEAKAINSRMYSLIERDRSEAESVEIRATTDAYLKGTLSKEQYEKELTKIGKRYSKERLNTQLLELESQLQIEKSKLGGLNSTDLQAAKDRITELETKIANLKTQLSGVAGGDKTEKDDQFQKDILKYIDGYDQIATAALNAFKAVNDAELSSINYSLELQNKRIEQAKTLRDRGNTEILDEEEKRSRILEDRKRKALARQQFLDRLSQLSSVAVGVAKIFADGDSTVALKIAASIGALVAGYAAVASAVPQPQRFFKGTPYARHPEGREGRDNIPAFLNKGERVTPTHINEAYYDSYEILESQKLTPKEAKKRLTAKTWGVNYERLEKANNVPAQIEQRRSQTDDLLQKQIQQNDIIIGLLGNGKANVNLSLDSRGFALSVHDANVRELARKS